MVVQIEFTLKHFLWIYLNPILEQLSYIFFARDKKHTLILGFAFHYKIGHQLIICPNITWLGVNQQMCSKSYLFQIVYMSMPQHNDIESGLLKLKCKMLKHITCLAPPKIVVIVCQFIFLQCIKHHILDFIFLKYIFLALHLN